ncbi:hypothetical protein Sant_3496 [Sodalis praecaptivus]|uniref:Uncharacterized protein n=1 Tax=Sodalis praecaptivus TaxID=1239307 RepID=W0I226_9GAMM|nr:hypothetical protein Sant_3496 [Sodalis praecaptivus]
MKRSPPASGTRRRFFIGNGAAHAHFRGSSARIPQAARATSSRREPNTPRGAARRHRRERTTPRARTFTGRLGRQGRGAGGHTHGVMGRV